MSRSKPVMLTCSQCGKPGQFRLYQSVNVTLDASLKTKVLDRSLVRFQCPACQSTATVVHDLLYHDMNLGLMIQLASGETSRRDEFLNLFKEGEGAEMPFPPITRVVGEYFELMDKIIAFDSGLDDRVLEVVKLVLSAHAPDDLREGAWYLEGIEANRLQLTCVTGSKNSGAKVERATYDLMHKQMKERGLLDSQELWAEIDRAYALIAMKTLRPDGAQ